MDIQFTEQGKARFGYKNLNAETSLIADDIAAIETIPVHETRFRRLVAPLSTLVEKIRILEEA